MIKRELYMDKIRPFINKNIIKVITGIRRSGKSVLLKCIIEDLKKEGISNENIIFINFEKMEYKHLKTEKELDKLIIEKTKNLKGKIYFFFDEIQEINGWEKSINSYLIDFDADIYITGSNANLLSGELATYIAGRYVEIKVYPFSYKEVLEIKKEELIKNRENIEKKPNKKDIELKLTKEEEKEIFEEYLKIGAMPAIFELKNSEEKIKYLEDIYNSILLKDIIKRNNIRDIDLLERILAYIIENIGRTFSAKSISKYFKHENRKVYPETVYNYLKYCENGCIINKAEREDLIGKKVLKLDEKYYLTDHGFREVLFKNNTKVINQILENIVYIEMLRRDYTVKVGKLKNKEIDFICEKRGEKVYIQVSYILIDESTINREFEPLLKIEDNYPKYVVTMDEIDMSDEGIIHQNIRDFLKNKNL